MISPDFALVSRIERTVRQQLLFRPGDTLVVALSGGADSTALLDLLTSLPDYNLHLVVAHLNHCLRGADSDADEEFCRGVAARYDIPFESRRVDVMVAASEKRLNLEDAGRRARIEFFAEIGVKYGATAVALAHHADDQAETVLMRLLRGSGMTGLSGMAYKNARGYVRPLLDITRSEIEQYLNMRGLEWREDASNSDTIYLRNRIRHELLPLLETYNPAIRSCFAATASIIRGDDELLDELTSQAFVRSCILGEGRVECDLEQLRGFKPALLQRVLRYAYQQFVGNLQGVGLCHIEAISRLIASDRPNAALSLPQQITAVRAYNKISFIHEKGEPLDADFDIQITDPGCYELPDTGALRVELSASGVVLTDSGIALVDLVKFPFPWHVRSFCNGDRIQPLGMSGHKKVKDIFIDRKIPASERKRIPLLFCGGDLLWIAGLCVSELSRVDARESTFVRVTWYNLYTADSR